MEEFSVQQFTDALNARVGLRFPKPSTPDEFVDSTRHSSNVYGFVAGTFFSLGMDVSDDARINLTEADKHKLLEQFAAKFATDLATMQDQPQTVHDYLLARIAAGKDPQARQALITQLAAMPEAALRAPKPFQQDAASGQITEGGPRFPLDDVHERFRHNFPELPDALRDQIMAALKKVDTGAGVTAEEVAKATTDAVPATITDRRSYLMRQMAESFVDDPRRFGATQEAWHNLRQSEVLPGNYFNKDNDLRYDASSGQVMIRDRHGNDVPFNPHTLRENGVATQRRSEMDLPDAVRTAAATITLASGTIRYTPEIDATGTNGLEAIDAKLRLAHTANQPRESAIVLT